MLKKENISRHYAKRKISYLFWHSLVRTPSYIEHLEKQEAKQLAIISRILASNKEQFLKDYKIIHPDIDDKIAEEDRVSILKGDDFELLPNRDLILSEIIQLGLKIGHIISQMSWSLLETSAENPFITSDNLINLYNPRIGRATFYQPGIGMPHSRLYIPISSTLTLLAINDDNFQEGKIFPLSTKGPIQENSEDLPSSSVLNEKVFKNSHRFVFANSNALHLDQI